MSTFFSSRIAGSTLVLLLILIAALSLRLYRLDWDEGTFLHPDELHVINTISTRITFDWPPDLENLLDPDNSRINPRSADPESGRPGNFAYGALPLFVVDLTGSTLTKLTGENYNDFFSGVYRVGRALSALLDTLTVFGIYLIGSRLRSREAGLIGAALYATTPLVIQLSHFFTTDVWMTAFATFSLYAAIRAAESGAVKWFTAAGALFGLAMASKGSVALLALVIAAAAMIDAGRRMNQGEARRYAIAAIPERLGLAALAAIVAFFLFEPYAVVHPMIYIDQLREQTSIIGGDLDVPYTRQYVGTTPLLYQLEHLIRWGAGPVAGMLYLAGGVTLATRARRRDPAVTLLLIWVVLQGAVILYPEAKFLRYLAPLLPALAAGAGLFVVAVVAWLARRWNRTVAAMLVSSAMLGVAFWTMAFMSIYEAENPRLEASRWMYQNIPAGSALTAETWDLALPVSMAPGLTSGDRQFEIIPMDMYGDRSPDVVADELYGVLERTDYVVLASNRVSSALPKSPWRYPVQIKYYELLSSGELGFTEVASFQNRPSFAGVSFDDANADESFVNYDHPTVRIFQKTGLIDRVTYDQLMAPAVDSEWIPRRHADESSLLLDRPVGEQPVVADARWSQSLTGRTVPALIVWILLLVLLQVIGVPLVARLFSRFPDLGWGFGRLVTILVAAYAVWILASLELISFRAIWCWVFLLLIAAVGWFAGLRTNLSRTLRPRFARFVGAELVFWGVFALFLGFRFVNPDSWHPIWGGEKPMEFAHLNAILRSAHFPPFDPWYADGYINYYYYGSYLVAFLFKLSGIPSEIAFNLAQPTAIALIASAGFSLVSAIARGLGVRRVVLAGFIGAFLLTLAGNLDSALRLAKSFPDEIEPTFFDWTWAGSRAVSGGITEFPYFTGLYADLHAHVIAWPITVLIAGLCFSLIQQARVVTLSVALSSSRLAHARCLLPALLMLSLAGGSLFATNAWDLPAFVALTGVSLFSATRGLRWLSLRLGVVAVALVVVALLGFLLFQPFFSHYVTLFGSLDRTRSQTDIEQYLIHFGVFLAIIAVGLVTMNLQRGVFIPALAWIDPVLIIALLAPGLVAIVTTESDLAMIAVLLFIVIVLTAGGLNAGLGMATEIGGRVALFGALAGTLISAALIAADRATLGLAIAFAISGVVVWLTGPSPAARFTGSLVAAGSSIVAGVEVVYLVDDLQSLDDYYRMNTVFKFYNQVWTLLAVSAAALFSWMLFGEARPHARGADEESERPRDIQSSWARAGGVVGTAMIVASLAYPLFATFPRLELRFDVHPSAGTLNALDWMRYGTLPRPDGTGVITFRDDLAVIDWFNENVQGSPVIVEASIGPYRGNGSRISIATGLPSVLGWDRHERQQRYPDGIDERYRDVMTLYRTLAPGRKMEILRRYGVEYIVVGDVERYSFVGSEPYASADGLATFESMVGRELEIAFQSGSTVVYRVLPPSTSPV